MRRLCAFLFMVMLVSSFSEQGRTQEKVKEPLTVLDGGGKEIKLQDWKFVTGTKTLPWLAEPTKAPEKKKAPAPSGPEYLEFREDKTPAYANDITTFIPITAVRKLDYDHEKKTVAVTVLTAGEKERTLVGPAKYVGVNKFNLDGTVEPGTLALTGEVKFQDGFLKAGIKGYRFPAAQPVAEPTGRPALIVALDKEKTVHKVHDLVPIYKVGGGYRSIPVLMFQKTVKVELGKLVKLTHLPAKGKKGIVLDFDVTLDDGTKQGLTLLEKTGLEDQIADLVGLAGKVPTGYRIFPAHTIAELRFEEKKP